MNQGRKLVVAAVAVLLCAMTAWPSAVQAQGQQVVAPPTNLQAADHPFDGGTNIDLTWTKSADDTGEDGNPVSGYAIYRTLTADEEKAENDDRKEKAIKKAKSDVTKSELGVDEYDVRTLTAEQRALVLDKRKAAAEEATYEKSDGWMFVSFALPGSESYKVDRLKRGESYSFRVYTTTKDGRQSAPAETTIATIPTRQWFEGARLWLLIITVVLCGAVIFWIYYARTGRPLKIRKIAGLEAVDEAVGRATEMGRPCLFVPGIQDMNDIQTIAGINILARVSKTAAEYDARVEVPTSRSLVMTTARETVEASFLEAGRPDAYNDDLIYYVTDEQFGYVAYLAGMMVREKPAACFYMGSFFAESLILAETGNSIGAIQIAGTAQPAQLPFFVAACDYTLIGEEFFAASAYLSGSPEELGSLKGQDVGKIIVAGGLLLGVFAATLGVLTGAEVFDQFVEFLRTTVFG